MPESKPTTQKVNKRTFTGTVVSTAMNKTITVLIDEMRLHSKYKKAYHVSRKFHVHDEKGEAKVGQTVKFEECRPLSKTKRWRLIASK